MRIVNNSWKPNIVPLSWAKLSLCLTLWLTFTTCFAHNVGDNESQLQPLSFIPSDLKTVHQSNVFENLIGDGYFDLWMMVGRTLRVDSTELAVAIGRRPGKVSTNNINDLPYFAVVSRAKTPIDGNEALKLGKSNAGPNKNAKQVAIEDTEIDISREDAQSFITSWFYAMKTAKYTDQIGGNDGVSIDFYSDGRAVHTWTPDHQSIAGRLEASGACLIRYVNTTESVRSGVMSECRSINAQLTKLVDDWTANHH